MEKDPAFLFYVEKFIMGTQTFTNDEVGQYVRLLCQQHQAGHMTKRTMNIIARVDEVSEYVLEKFVVDEDGKYYNKKLDTEMQRRASYTKSRMENLKKKKLHIDDHKKCHKEDDMDTHMDTHMEDDMGSHIKPHTLTITKDINIDINKDINRSSEIDNFAPKKQQRKKYGQYGWVLLSDAELERLEAEYGYCDVNHYINYVDESAQQTGNKNKWKDWNVVVKKAIREQWGKGNQRKLPTDPYEGMAAKYAQEERIGIT